MYSININIHFGYIGLINYISKINLAWFGEREGSFVLFGFYLRSMATRKFKITCVAHIIFLLDYMML